MIMHDIVIEIVSQVERRQNAAYHLNCDLAWQIRRVKEGGISADV